MEDSSRLLKTGTDVAVILPDDQSFPGRVKRVLKDGYEVDEIEWVGAGEGFTLELSDGRMVSTRDVVPGSHHCSFCDRRLKQVSIGVFACSCKGWIGNQ